MSNNGLSFDQVPLQISGVSKAFGEHKVLDNIDFSVMPGEIFGLIGLNGVGKTTLIKIILDLLNPDSGEVRFFGKPHKDPKSRKALSYLPEKFYPSQFLKGKEFLDLALSYYGKHYVKEEACAKAKILGLEPGVLEHKISNYSKGMGQKLGLLSMFLSEVPLLILDEPMSGLDPSARIQLKELLLDYARGGKTIFFSSHILSDIDEICQRIAIISDGKLLFVGKPAEFRERYSGQTLERAFLEAISAPAGE